MKCVYIYVVSKNFQKWYYGCLTHMILEILCYLLIMSGKEYYLQLHTLLYTWFSHPTFIPSFQIKIEIAFPWISKLIFFPVLLKVWNWWVEELLILAHSIMTWYLDHVIITYSYKMLYLFILEPFFPPFCEIVCGLLCGHLILKAWYPIWSCIFSFEPRWPIGLGHKVSSFGHFGGGW